MSLNPDTRVGNNGVFLSFILCQRKQGWMRWHNIVFQHTTVPWFEFCSNETMLLIHNWTLLILLPLLFPWGKANWKKKHKAELPQRAEVTLWSWGLISISATPSYHQQLTVIISTKAAPGTEVIIWCIISITFICT